MRLRYILIYVLTGTSQKQQHQHSLFDGLGELVTRYTPKNTKRAAQYFSAEKLSCPTHTAAAVATNGCT